MSGYIEGKIDTKPYRFLPTCYDEMISEDNPVRVLDVFVDSLDMKQLNFKNTDRQSSAAGRPDLHTIQKIYLNFIFMDILMVFVLLENYQKNVKEI